MLLFVVSLTLHQDIYASEFIEIKKLKLSTLRWLRGELHYAGHDEPIGMDEILDMLIEKERCSEVETKCKEFNSGLRAFYSGNGEAAVEHWQIGALQGHAASQIKLAEILSYGLLVERDTSSAENWYSKAASSLVEMTESDDLWATYQLGLLYNYGRGIPRDEFKALQHIKHAANRGHVEAQETLGYWYQSSSPSSGFLFSGRVIYQDLAASIHWYQSAARGGSNLARVELKEIYKARLGLPNDSVQALEWLQMAAREGDMAAQFELASSYFAGIGSPQDYVLAHVWFNLASSSGDIEAKRFRKRLESQMSSSSVVYAQALARRCLASNYQECGD